MNKKIMIIVFLWGLVGGFYVCKKWYPEIRTVTQEVQVVNNVNTVKRIIKRPDGTVEKDIRIVDKSVSKSKETVKQVKSKEPSFLIGPTVSFQDFKLKPVYGAQVQYRILGPVYVGASVNIDGYLGLGISYAF